MKPEGKTKEQLGATESADKNVMPSMVVRQQKIHQMGTGPNLRPTVSGAVDGGSTVQTVGSAIIPASSPIKAAYELSGIVQQQQQQTFDQNGLVVPKRVLHYPTSMGQPVIRDLNRELKFNQTRGKNVLDQKSELKKALEKLEQNKRKKEAEQERLNRRTSLELRLEERAEKIAKETKSSEGDGAGPHSTTCNPLTNFSIRSMER